MANLILYPKIHSEYIFELIITYEKKKVKMWDIDLSEHFVVVALVQIVSKKVWNMPDYICVGVWIQYSMFIYLRPLFTKVTTSKCKENTGLVYSYIFIEEESLSQAICEVGRE